MFQKTHSILKISLLFVLCVFALGCQSPPQDIDPDTKQFLQSQNWKKGLLQIDFMTPHGEVGELPKNVVVHFSQPMVALSDVGQPVSEVSFFKITPHLDGHFEWANTQALVFTPQDGFSDQKNYQVSISSTTESLLGRALLKEKNFSFQIKSSREAMNQWKKTQEHSESFSERVDLNQKLKPKAKILFPQKKIMQPFQLPMNQLNMGLSLEQNQTLKKTKVKVRGVVFQMTHEVPVYVYVLSSRQFKNQKTWPSLTSLNKWLLRQTVFFQKSAYTNRQGEFQLEFDAPEETGQYWVLALTRKASAKWGGSSVLLDVQEPLQIYVDMPDVVTVDDRFLAKIHFKNTTNRMLKFKWESLSPEIQPASSQNDTIEMIPKGERAISQWFHVLEPSQVFTGTQGGGSASVKLVLKAFGEELEKNFSKKVILKVPTERLVKRKMRIITDRGQILFSKNQKWDSDFGGLRIRLGPPPEILMAALFEGQTDYKLTGEIPDFKSDQLSLPVDLNSDLTQEQKKNVILKFLTQVETDVDQRDQVNANENLFVKFMSWVSEGSLSDENQKLLLEVLHVYRQELAKSFDPTDFMISLNKAAVVQNTLKNRKDFAELVLPMNMLPRTMDFSFQRNKGEALLADLKMVARGQNKLFVPKTRDVTLTRKVYDFDGKRVPYDELKTGKIYQIRFGLFTPRALKQAVVRDSLPGAFQEWDLRAWQDLLQNSQNDDIPYSELRQNHLKVSDDSQGVEINLKDLKPGYHRFSYYFHTSFEGQFYYPGTELVITKDHGEEIRSAGSVLKVSPESLKKQNPIDTDSDPGKIISGGETQPKRKSSRIFLSKGTRGSLRAKP